MTTPFDLLEEDERHAMNLALSSYIIALRGTDNDTARDVLVDLLEAAAKLGMNVYEIDETLDPEGKDAATQDVLRRRAAKLTARMQINLALMERRETKRRLS